MFEISSGRQLKPIKVVIYGPAGVGKSTLAANFPNPLFIDTEDSTVHMDVKRLKRPSTFTELVQMIRWVAQTKPCSTLIIDTADWAEALSEKQVIDENNIKSIEDIGYGAGYVKAREKYGSMLDELTSVIDAGINTVLVAHSKVVKFEDPAVLGAYDRYELKLSDRKNAHTSELTKEWADMILFVNYETFAQKSDDTSKALKGQGGKRMMFTTRQPAWDAKNRFGLSEALPLEYSHIAHVIPDLISQQQTMVFTPPQDVPPTPMSEPTISDVTPAQLQEELFEPTNAYPAFLPVQLTDLMLANNVTVDELQGVMGLRGHFPINTDFKVIADSTPEYFIGGLAANWEGVMQVINSIRQNRNQLVDLFAKVGEPDPQAKVNSMVINNI